MARNRGSLKSGTSRIKAKKYVFKTIGIYYILITLQTFTAQMMILVCGSQGVEFVNFFILVLIKIIYRDLLTVDHSKNSCVHRDSLRL